MQTPRYIPNDDWELALAYPDAPHHRLLLAKEERRVIGWCRLFPNEHLGGKRVYELGIGLLHANRRQGLGSRLIAAAKEWAKKNEADAIILVTHYENLPAQIFFQQHGFTETGTAGLWIEMVVKI